MLHAPTSIPKCNAGHSRSGGVARAEGMAGRRGFRPFACPLFLHRSGHDRACRLNSARPVGYACVLQVRVCAGIPEHRFEESSVGRRCRLSSTLRSAIGTDAAGIVQDVSLGTDRLGVPVKPAIPAVPFLVKARPESRLSVPCLACHGGCRPFRLRQIFLFGA